MTVFPESDHRFMSLALEQASLAGQMGEVPVGAVVTLDNQVVSKAHNQQISLNDPSAHAEIIALRAAGEALGNYRLPDCELFVTLEPCTMCCGATVHARIKRLVFAAREPKAGAVVSALSTLEHPALNHHVEWHDGLLSAESATILQDFFRARRTLKAGWAPPE